MKKDLKVALALIVVAICIATTMNYKDADSALFGDNVMAKPVFTDNLSDSYNRLKQDLKDKYAELIYKIVDKIKTDIIKETSEIFSEETFSKIEEAEELKSEINSIKQDFYAEERYKALQEELVSLKEKLANTSEDEAKELTKEMQGALDKISTLNITLKNRIKDKTDRLYKLNLFIEGEFDKNREILSNLKNELFEKVKIEIIECLDDFNDELAVLNETFGKESEDAEMPFDESTIKVDIPLFSYLNETNDGNTYILSENDNTIKN